MPPFDSRTDGSEDHNMSGPQSTQQLSGDAALKRSVWPRCRKIALKVKGKILFIDPTQIISVHSEGNYVVLRKDSCSYFLRGTLSNTMTKLEPYGFVRIQRSTLVNTLFVEEIRPFATGEYGLRIKGGKEYTVTRTYKRNLKFLADVWVGTGNFLSQ
jgi:DNA-binding LytR/AlgR family response regulator